MNPVATDILMHYGVGALDGPPGRGSGRYPRGSGENPFQHGGTFLNRLEELKAAGITKELDQANALGISTTQLRLQKTMAKHAERSLKVEQAETLKAQGLSTSEIGRRMGLNESSVRSLLNARSKTKMETARNTAEILKKEITEKGMLDVGPGLELELGISSTKLQEALGILREEGYEVWSGRIPQPTDPSKQTTLTALCAPGTPHREIYDHPENIKTFTDYVSHDGGETYDPKYVYPKSMDSKRLMVRYKEDGGIDKDGLVELRRNVDDLNLGNSHYAQVRILVDGTHYIKGMAVYSDDLPDGIDVMFNTNKSRGTPVLGKDKKNSVLKPIGNDPDNPFGSLIKEGIVDPDAETDRKGGQSYYYDKNGKKQLSLINKRAEEGDWEEWKDKLPSQFLAKQNKTLMRRQLKISMDNKQAELDDILDLTNPTVKRYMLSSFADDCDSAAIHLQAAALPRQHYRVLIPIPEMNDNEVYAPTYRNGEQVALIRYPHGGTFEIPILTVNNRRQAGKKVLEGATDAVGINAKVAARLSGADFDGDTVMVIPTGGNIKVTSTPALRGLDGFDPKEKYGPATYEGRTVKLMRNTQTEMGVISNLITDMTLKGADKDELAAAVRHSMVVIDAEKHQLDYKKSEADNHIAALKRKYQGHVDDDGKYHEGASTLISRAKSTVRIDKRVGSGHIDPKTGEVSYKQVHEEYTDKNGKTKVRTTEITRMENTLDARTLISDADTPAERAYAEYANKMKALANTARKEMLATGRLKSNPTAKKTYAEEVGELEAALRIAKRNAPKERQALIIANTAIKAVKQDNPDMSKAEKKKYAQRAISTARTRVGAQRHSIPISDRQWAAIQAGAISDNMLTEILRYADTDSLRQRATPYAKGTLSNAKIARIKALSSGGYTPAEIADSLGVSTTTVNKYLKG